MRERLALIKRARAQYLFSLFSFIFVNKETATSTSRTILAARLALAHVQSCRCSAVLDAKIKDLPEADSAKRAMHERALVSRLCDVIVEMAVVVFGMCSGDGCYCLFDVR